jgi:hypothetical protein
MNVMKDYMYADQATRYQVVKNHFERAVHDAKVRHERKKRREGDRRGGEKGRRELYCVACCFKKFAIYHRKIFFFLASCSQRRK